MEIMVRKYTAAPRFHPHFNQATGRYYGTSSEYYSDLKRRGLEPFDGNMEHRSDSNRKSYKPSKEANEVYKAIHDASRDGKFRAGDRLKDKIMQMSRGKPVVASQVDLAKLPAHYQKGGWG